MKQSRSKGLVRSVGVLASGTAAAQVITLLSAPILTRLYTPDQFGVLSIYIAIVGIVGAASTLRFELVVPLPRHDGLAANAMALTLFCVLATSLVSAAILFLLADYIAAWLGYDELPSFSFLVPLGILAIGTYTGLSNWAVRQRAFPVIARTKLLQAVSQSGIQIASAFTPFATFGLVLGNLLGQSMGIGSFVRTFHRRDRAVLRDLSWKKIRFLAAHHWKFPAFSLPASVAFSASQHLPAVVLFSMFGPASSGFYLLAQRVGMLPASLLGNAISQSIYRNLADNRKSPKAIGNAAKVPVLVTAGLLISPAALVAVFAPLVVGVAFGAAWEEAGHYLRWMAPWVCATIIFGAMSPIVSVLGFQKLGLAFQVGSLALSLLGMMIAGHFWGSIGAVAGFAITKTISILIYRLHMFHLVGISPWPIAGNLLLQGVAFGLLFSLTGYLLAEGNPEQPFRWGYIAIAICLASALYAFVVYATIRWARRGSVNALIEKSAS